MNREAFEKSYAETHDLPLETFSQYRMGDTYRLPGIASHWRTWLSALDSVVVELPELREDSDAIDAAGVGLIIPQFDQGYDEGINECRQAIVAAGLKVAK